MWTLPEVLLSFLPGVLLFFAIGHLLSGVAMHWAFLAWAVLVFCAVVALSVSCCAPRLGDEPVALWHYELVPAETMPLGPFLAVLALPCGCLVAGVTAFLRRDVD